MQPNVFRAGIRLLEAGIMRMLVGFGKRRTAFYRSVVPAPQHKATLPQLVSDATLGSLPQRRARRG